MHDLPPGERQAEVDIADAEALFKEAKQRERRRRLIVLGCVLALLIGVAALVSSATTGAKKAHPKLSSTVTRPSRSKTTATGAFVTPRQPNGLALAKDGTLYVVDPGRDRILHRLVSGKFQVVAGTGKIGFSGDGRPAIDAKLSLSNMSGIVVAANGTIYFSDTGNGRVREILPNGIIKTVAGGGSNYIAEAPMPALKAAFCRYACVEGLAFGPNRELYIGANDVYRLDAQGNLQWVAGAAPPRPLPSNWPGPYGNPAVQYDFTNVNRLAFDGRGDLIVAGGGDWGVYERTVSGQLIYLEKDRVSGGEFGPLAETSNGDVLVEGGVDVGSNGTLDLGSTSNSPKFGTSQLDLALGSYKRTGIAIFVPQGIAVSSHGTQYLDTNSVQTPSFLSGIVEVRTNGSIVTLWKA